MYAVFISTYLLSLILEKLDNYSTIEMVGPKQTLEKL